jgi:hypothetical protein
MKQLYRFHWLDGVMVSMLALKNYWRWAQSPIKTKQVWGTSLCLACHLQIIYVKTISRKFNKVSTPWNWGHGQVTHDSLTCTNLNSQCGASMVSLGCMKMETNLNMKTLMLKKAILSCLAFSDFQCRQDNKLYNAFSPLVI